MAMLHPILFELHKTQNHRRHYETGPRKHEQQAPGNVRTYWQIEDQHAAIAIALAADDAFDEHLSVATIAND
jgi:hypothetical protein